MHTIKHLRASDDTEEHIQQISVVYHYISVSKPQNKLISGTQ